MPPRLLLTAALAAAALAAAPAAASAAPPANDNYLASLPIDSTSFTAQVDTTEATIQPDLFNPSRTGQPLGGDGPENTTCNGTSFGKTVWYDLEPAVAGGLSITTGGFAAVVTVYQWDNRDNSPTSSKIVKTLGCEARPAEPLDVDLEAGKAYTVQIGGVSGPAGVAGGLLTVKADFFPDRDGDGVLDALDKCKTVPGVERYGGCPPQLNVAPTLAWTRGGGGITIGRLAVDRVPKGAKVVAKCPGCGTQTVKAKRSGRVVLTKLAGKSVRNGASIEVRVTMAKTGTGTYRFGATGAYFKWPVAGGALGSRLARCLNVTSGAIERC